jgi:hypothetical protein
MAHSLKIRCSAVALMLGMFLAACGSSADTATPQPGGAAVPTASETPAAATMVAATAVATPAADSKPALSDEDIAATIVAAPSSP